MMKKCVSLLFVFCLLTSSCGTKTTQVTQEAINTPTWQEQYDLGVRYLSEGNYQEAIIAFTAAIEIDPRQSKAYVGLADSYIGLGDYEKALQAIEDGKSNCGEDDSFARMESNVEFLNSGDTGIRITDFYFDKATYLAGAETNFLVSVAYRCPENEECILMIGANTAEPDSFRMMDQDYTVTGSGGYQFNVTLTPARWDDADFGIYVNLSEADHGEHWTPFGTDRLYIDAQGNVILSKAVSHDDREVSGPIPQLYGTVSNTHIEPPMEGHNEGSVGQLTFDLTWDTSSVPQEIEDKIATAYIATWGPDGFSSEEIAEEAAFYEEIWQGEGTVWKSYPDMTGAGFPIWEDDYGTQQTVLMYAVDESCNIVGYLVLDVQIPTA